MERTYSLRFASVLSGGFACYLGEQLSLLATQDGGAAGKDAGRGRTFVEDEDAATDGKGVEIRARSAGQDTRFDLAYGFSANTLCESIHKRPLVKQDTTSKQVHSAVSDGWMHGGSFVSSIIAGTLLGYSLDMWLGTDPWLVIIGIVVGTYSGFVKMWGYIKEMDEDPVREH